MYSLVSASVLASDLARHPSGAAVADTVDRVLALIPRELDRFGPPAGGSVRGRVLAAVTDQPPPATSLQGAVQQGLATGRTVADVLAQTLLGTLEDLLALLAREAPLAGAAPAARQVALDAVTVAWAGRVADLSDLAALRQPWTQGLDAVPPALPDALVHGPLGALLDELSRRGPEQWERVAQAHGARTRALTWSKAMHVACQAAHDAGLVRDVARAQLGAARLLRLSGASTGPHAHAIAMAVTSAVQATCVRHLLAEPEWTALTGAWTAGS